MKVVSRIFAYLRRYPMLASGTLFSALVSTVTVLVFPKVTQDVIDQVIVKGEAARLWPNVWLAAGAFFFATSSIRCGSS